jgi:hypothetical protein
MSLLCQAPPLGRLYRASRCLSLGRSRARCLYGPFPDSPLRTGRAIFTAPGSPELGIPPQDYPWFVSHFSFPQVLRQTFMPHPVNWYSGSPYSCRPSPCGRFSRPPTTMAAPTLSRFHRPICRAPFQDSLSRSRCSTLQRGLGGGYQSTQSALRGIPIRRQGKQVSCLILCLTLR